MSFVCWKRWIYGGQQLSLAGHCLRKHIIQREFMHVLGFINEHTRSDRDRYIKINWQNIRPIDKLSFLKHASRDLGIGYDYQSIMHYGKFAFSANGKQTIEPIYTTPDNIGKTSLSNLDKIKIQLLYGCATLIPGCFDRFDDCETRKHFCWLSNNMKKQCRKTCGLC